MDVSRRELHLRLACAAYRQGPLVSHWLRCAGEATTQSLLDPRVCESVGLSPATAKNWLTASPTAAPPPPWQSLCLLDADYPPLLATLAEPPPVLYVRGDLHHLSAPQVAIVGSRHPSMEGRENAFAFARELARAGFHVTSGLALGVDAAAHRGALRAGGTIAVMGCGPDRIYPARQQRLAEQIAQQGALVTEFPPGAAPLKPHFPRRNRIISGLSLATVVVEAAIHSGSLITARLAAEQGREVFAIPGSIHNPMSKGCHRLLRDGACWLEEMADLLQALDAMEHLGRVPGQDSDAVHEPLLDAFTGGLNSLDQLQARSGLPAEQLTRELTRLELEGLVERLPGGYQSAGPLS